MAEYQQTLDLYYRVMRLCFYLSAVVDRIAGTNEMSRRVCGSRDATTSNGVMQ